jgi:hypothetical protein
VANAVSAAIPAMPICCECSVAVWKILINKMKNCFIFQQNRCSTDSCPCYATRRMCDEHCESARYRGDCLNQAICKVYSIMNKINFYNQFLSSALVKRIRPNRPKIFAQNQSVAIAFGSRNLAQRWGQILLNEYILFFSQLCACKQICKNKEPPKRAVKVNKPAQG